MPRPAPSAGVVVLFSAGCLPAYLLPTLVGQLVCDLGLTATQAGAVGSALLLASALVGLPLAGRVRAIGPARLACAGLGLLTAGFALEAAAGTLPLLLTGCLLGGLGAGTVTAVAGVGVAAAPDPHRASVYGLLLTSAAAAALYLLLPCLGGGHALPFAALAAYGLLAWPAVRRLPSFAPDEHHTDTSRLPRRAAGVVLAGGMLLWSMAQNALWGVSGEIGAHRVGLSESALGLVFALALGGGLLGVAAAGALGIRFGRARPIGLGTFAIACCVAVSGGAHSAVPFAAGELLWNILYPLVLSQLIGLAAALDTSGRWSVLCGAASCLGVAGGPLLGTLLSSAGGFPAMGAELAALLLAVAVPLTLLARRPRPNPVIWLPRQRTSLLIGSGSTEVGVG